MNGIYVEQKEPHSFIPDEAEEITLSMSDVSPLTKEIRVKI